MNGSVGFPFRVSNLYFGYRRTRNNIPLNKALSQLYNGNSVNAG